MFARGLCRRDFYDPAIRPLYAAKEVHRNWTAREMRDLADMVKMKWTNEEIALALGRTKSSVAGARTREGLRRWRRKPPGRAKEVIRLVKKKMSDTRIGLVLGISKHTVYTTRVANGYPQSLSDTKAIIAQSSRNWAKAHGYFAFERRRDEDRAEVVAQGWPVGCNPGQARVMGKMLNGPVRSREIALPLGLTVSGVSHHLRGMRKLGWVVKAGGKAGTGVRWRINWNHPDWDDRPIRLKHGPREQVIV